MFSGFLENAAESRAWIQSMTEVVVDGPVASVIYDGERENEDINMKDGADWLGVDHETTTKESKWPTLMVDIQKYRDLWKPWRRGFDYQGIATIDYISTIGAEGA